MKYIVGVVFSILMFGLAACGNDGSESPVITRKKTSFLGLEMYKGSENEGAEKVNLYADPKLNQDNLFRSLTLFKYLSKFSNAIENESRISFEFLDNGILSFTDLTKNSKIISSYVYIDDSLFILKNGTEKLFVAVKEGDNSGFYRTKSVMRKILYNEDPKKPVDDTLSVKDKLIDLNIALEFAGFNNAASMTNTRDTVVWCNVKYLYN